MHEQKIQRKKKVTVCPQIISVLFNTKSSCYFFFFFFFYVYYKQRPHLCVLQTKTPTAQSTCMSLKKVFLKWHVNRKSKEKKKSCMWKGNPKNFVFYLNIKSSCYFFFSMYYKQKPQQLNQLINYNKKMIRWRIWIEIKLKFLSTWRR